MISNLIGFSEPEEGPLSNFHTYAPDMMNLFIKGIKDNTKALQDQIIDTFDFGNSIDNGIKGVDVSGNIDAVGTNSYSAPITINVYGTEGQDVNELAEIISRRIAYEQKKQTMAWGMA
jgi:hypothetical protein